MRRVLWLVLPLFVAACGAEGGEGDACETDTDCGDGLECHAHDGEPGVCEAHHDEDDDHDDE